MKLVCSFFTKFQSLISCIFSCFDRTILKGHLPISWPSQFEKFIDYQLKITRNDFFKKVGKQWTERIVSFAQQYAKKNGRLYQFHQGNINKDDWAKEQIQKHSITQGLVGILCVMESCFGYKLKYAEGRPIVGGDNFPMRVLYYYFLDRDFGLIHVRIQTYAPYTCQVYINGHNYVARELARKGIAFEQIDNVFVKLSDPEAAQKIADRFAKLNWPKILEHFARRVNPLLSKELRGMSHYWVIDQAEYATDVVFVSKEALQKLFLRLLEYALLAFSPKKIFEYLGRRYHGKFDGEVQTQYKSVREPGACVKHYMRKNWLKMYDKLGLVLRVETVINQPGEFKVYRKREHRDGSSSLGMYAMCKGVGNFHHYQSQALACNLRYLEALSAVDDPTPTYDDMKKLTEQKKEKGRSYAGFNPAREEEAKLFAAVLAGDHIAQGFRNKDIREALKGVSTEVKERQRQSAAIGRIMKRLHVRGMVVKVPRTRRWRVTAEGRRIMGDTLLVYRRYEVKAA